MKTFVVLSVLVALVTSKPSGIGAPLIAPLAYSAPTFAIAQPVVVNAISSQYHAQDTLGQYTYGYASPLSSKAETKTIDGITRGGYTYLDAQGLVQAASYVADPVNGFRVAATNIPVGPTQNIAPIELAPKQVPDSPEVAAAKAVHFAAIEEAKARVAAANAIEAAQIETKLAAVPVVPVSVPVVPVSVPAIPATVKTNTDAEKVETVSEDKETPKEPAAKQTQEAVSTAQIKSTVPVIAPPAISYAYTNIIGAHQPAFIASAPQILLPNSISTYSSNIIAGHAPLQLIGQVPVAPPSSDVVVETKSEKLSDAKTAEKISTQAVEISAPLNYVAGWAPYYLTNK